MAVSGKTDQAREQGPAWGPGRCEGNNCPCRAWVRKITDDGRCANPECNHPYDNHGF